MPCLGAPEVLPPQYQKKFSTNKFLPSVLAPLVDAANVFRIEKHLSKCSGYMNNPRNLDTAILQRIGNFGKKVKEDEEKPPKPPHFS